MKARKEPPAITRSSAAEYLTYVASVGDTSESFEIRYADEDIWLTQKMLVRLYGVEIPAISYHLKKLFADAEIDRDSVIKNFLITASDGKFISGLCGNDGNAPCSVDNAGLGNPSQCLYQHV